MNTIIPKNPLWQTIRQWIARTFADPGATGLFFTVVLALLIVEFFGHIITPILISLAIAYLLSGLMDFLMRRGVPKCLSLTIVFVLFLAVLAWVLAGLMPMLVRQLTNMLNELPGMFITIKAWLSKLSSTYPSILGPSFANDLAAELQNSLIAFGKGVLSFSLTSIGGIITIVLYVFLVPLMVFFMLKDKKSLLLSVGEVLPKDRSILLKVCSDVNHQIGQYIRGRVIEIIIVSIVSIITFAFCGLQYAILLGVLVGLSVIIPYVGALLVSIPVGVLALIQWGMSWHFLVAYGAFWIIIALDGNLLVPLLFAGTMDMSALAIILSVLIFGDIWGFWGVFLSIPLASVVKAIWTAWPRAKTAVEI